MRSLIPVGSSAARIATIEPHPNITFRDYILPFLRKSLLRAVQAIRQSIMAVLLAGTTRRCSSIGFKIARRTLLKGIVSQGFHHLIGRNTVCEGVRAAGIWRGRALRAIGFAKGQPMGGSNGENAMLIHRLATLTGLAVATLFLAAPANALTMAECSTKYNAAKDAGTLNGQTWNQFR
ncbi:MAG: hypothetical protein E5V40_19540, partial [Mesorhizobium sp.]